MWLTSPIRKASAAGTLLAVMNISRAAASPIRRGRRWVPPQPVIIPRLAPEWQNSAFGEAILVAHAKARSRAPPKQYPLTAAIVAPGKSEIRAIRCWPRAANSLAVEPSTDAISRRSAPEAKTSSTPVNTRRSASDKFDSASIKDSRTSIDKGLLISGRLRVMTAAGPRRSMIRGFDISGFDFNNRGYATHQQGPPLARDTNRRRSAGRSNGVRRDRAAGHRKIRGR